MLKENINRIYSNLKEDINIIKEDMSDFMSSTQKEDIEDSLPEYKEPGLLSYDRFKSKAESLIKNMQDKRSASKEKIKKLDKIKQRIEKIEKILPHYEQAIKKESKQKSTHHFNDFIEVANKYRTKPIEQKPIFEIKEKPRKVKSPMHDLAKDIIIEHLPKMDYIKEIEKAEKIFKEKQSEVEIIQKIKPPKVKKVSFLNNEIKEFNILAKQTYIRIKKKELKEAIKDYNALNLIYTNVLGKTDSYTELSLYNVMHDLYDKLEVLKLIKQARESSISAK